MKSLLRLRNLLKPYYPFIILSFTVLLMLTGIDMVLPEIIRQVIDIGLKPGQQQFLLTAGGILLGLGLLKALMNFAQRFLAEWVAHHFAYDLRNQLYDRIQRMPFTFHDHAQSGQLISRCIEDVRSVQNFTGHGIIDLTRVILLLVAILIILFSTNPRLAVFALLPMIPMFWVTFDYGKRVGKLFYKVDHDLGELSSRLQENVTGAQVVRAFARENHEVQHFDEANKTLYNSQLKVTWEWSKIMPTTGQLVTLGTILILWFGGNMVLNHELTLGELVAFNSYMLLLAGPAQQISWLVNGAGEASAGMQRALDILDHIPEIQSPPNPIVLPQIKGRVDFENVSFIYQGEKVPALYDINLSIEPNKIIALIGPTGSGKTTLVNLIPRFYDVTEGAVKVDGYDVRKVDLKSLRQQIGIVLQTSLLFSASVTENICYGRPGAPTEEVIAAAKAAQAHDFIMSLPKQYETVIGERGVTLSGGQRQRIAIARALLMNPRILILDDSTSSVDTQTEYEIQTALSRLMQGRTTFIIAQRLSSVKRADMIIVLDQGRIKEIGTHQQLLDQNGLYRKIYELQLRDQEKFRDEVETILAGQGIAPSQPITPLPND